MKHKNVPSSDVMKHKWKRLPLDVLLMNPDNPNSEDSRIVVRLRNALTEFGFVQNIVVTPSKKHEDRYIIVGGNHRVEVLRAMDKPPKRVMCCIIPPMSKARRLLLAQGLNQIHGSDNREQATELYESLIGKLGAEAVDRIVGHQTAVQRVLQSREDAVRDATEDEDDDSVDLQPGEELPAQRMTFVENTTHNADCRLLRFPKNCFDSIVTDPPYMVGIFEKPWDSGENVGDFTRDWVTRHLHSLKPGGLLAIFINANQYDLVARALRECKLTLRDPLIWIRYISKIPGKRLNKVGTVYTTTKFCYEMIAVAQKPPIGTYEQNFKRYGTGGFFFEDCLIPWASKKDKDNALKLGADILQRARAGKMGGRGHRALQGNTKGWITLDGGRRPGNVIILPDDKGRFVMPENWESYFCIPTIRKSRSGPKQHETEKRVELTAWAVKLLTPPNGVVADFFSGRATTGVAAMQSGRRFVLVERNRKNYRRGMRRLERLYAADED